MFISIVTPCYNVSSFLDDYFDSLFSQTHHDFEIILVDDGSKDNTWEKLHEFQQKDSRIRIYQLETNSGGCKIPRETAISHANSDWIVAVDADDFLDKDYLEKLVNRQVETSADLVYSRTILWSPEKQELTIPDKEFDFSQILSSENALDLCVGGWKISSSGALVRKTLITNSHNYLQKAKLLGRDNLDELTSREVIIGANRLAFADTNYYARINMSSVTRSNPRQFYTYGTDLDLYHLLKHHYGAESQITRKALTAYISHIMRIVRKGEQINEDILNHLSMLKNKDIWNSSLSFNRKIRTTLRLHHLKRKYGTINQEIKG